LQTIPGIQQEAAGNLLAETGSDMKQFADAGHLSSWGGICPGNNESAGKHKSRHTTHGNPWFRVTLTECAWSASRTKGTAFQAKYESLKPKIGHKRALVAVAHLLTHAIYHVLSRGEEYRETKPKELNEIQRQRIIRRHTRRLRRLGAGFQPKNSLPCRNGMSRIASRTSIPLSPSAKVGRKQCYGTVNL
jgi:transposase